MPQPIVVSRLLALTAGLSPVFKQQKAAGAVGVFGAARREAGLAKRGRLLIARTTGQRNRPRRTTRPTFRRNARSRRGPRGNIARGMSRIAQQLVVPIERVNVEQQRAAGVAIVGHVQPAAAQPPQQPGVDRAEQDFAALGPGRASRRSCRAGA